MGSSAGRMAAVRIRQPALVLIVALWAVAACGDSTEWVNEPADECLTDVRFFLGTLLT